METLKDPNGAQAAKKTLNYTYDLLGNIEIVSEGSAEKLRYHHDNLSQLEREDNKYLNKTIVYSYDRGGNLTEAKQYAYQTGDTLSGTGTTIKSYTYGDSNWKDKLTEYNSHAITYDAIGNPLSYHNNWTFTWQKGRQLAGASNGTDTISYGYNPDGYRTSKTVNGVTTKYTLEGSLVKFEKTGSTNTWYYYDASGAPVGMAAGASNLYLYRKNLQGDITGIYSGSTGALLVSYDYDAWGKPTITNVAGTTESTNLIARNPYLYRGYRYDHETGLYYLNSRYYDPETGRWINADGIVAGVGSDVKGHNLFEYCFNNPVNFDDQTGNWPEWLKDAVKWVADSVVKPVVKTVEKVLAEVDITYSRGCNVSFEAVGLIGNFQIGIAMDTKGNIAMQASGGGGFTSGDNGISFSRFECITNAPNIDKLNGPSAQTGGSVGVLVYDVPIYGGGDVMCIPDFKEQTAYFGFTGNVGVGTPGYEGHIEMGMTDTIPCSKFNVFDVARSVYKKIMEW